MTGGTAYLLLFSGAKIGNLQIQNRIVMASMATNFASTSGDVTERMLNYYSKGANARITSDRKKPRTYLPQFAMDMA